LRWTALTERIEKKDALGMLVEISAEKRPFWNARMVIILKRMFKK
jgi:hypothetical protein